MMDKLCLQPSRCNLPHLPTLNINLFTRISLFLFIVFYSRKKGLLYFWVMKDSISSFKLHYILWHKLFKSACSTLNILCIYKPAQITKSRDCGDEGAQSNRAAGLPEEGCLILFVTSGLPTYWSWHTCIVNAYLHSNLAKVRPYSFLYETDG